jgi:hypothetical protein
LSQSETLIKGQEKIDDKLARITPFLEEIATFAKQVHTQVWDKLTDSAPPAKHTIDQQSYTNPFVLVRSEDFNHNYEKLARLFQDSPDWGSIRSRTDNVFIEGGRGTGKSMLLRRLTAQATIAAARLGRANATFEQLNEDYFGVYIKLTRGYYDHFKSVETVSPEGASLLAQHELNVETFDAFVETLRWLDKERAISTPQDSWSGTVSDLSGLFPKAPPARTLDDLQQVVRFEQDQIMSYYREKAFANAETYAGSAQETVNFLRRLSEIFRKRLFPGREIRLFLLFDEFETLLELQQTAVNTAIKMRLPDLSIKIAVRKSGRKTSDTFTPGDPIQDPRDYIPIFVDYDVQDSKYKDLLEGIAAKRLKDAGYPNKDIRAYLTHQPDEEDVESQELNKELATLWASGNRRSTEPNKEFRTKYSLAAIYRILSKRNKRKSFSGFEQYCALSSGNVSNFIEQCKYAFYFALNDGLALLTVPAIPPYLQTEAAYRVSQRLLATINGNVPKVGGVLANLLNDLGAILRRRLLNNSSEPEANRLSVEDYSELADSRNSDIAEIVDSGVTWSVFHLEQSGRAFRPKNFARAPSVELVINRIYCPALRISPRARWRVPLRIADIRALANPQSRAEAYKNLSYKIGGAETGKNDFFSDGAK